MSTTYKIGELAEQLGTTVRTIRYYEEEGLLTPLRSERGTRRYNERHLARLRAIMELADNGFTLEAIHRLVSAREACETGDQGSREVPARLDAVIEAIRCRQKELEKLGAELGAARSMVQRCRGCTNRPNSRDCPGCPVNRHLQEIGMLNLIWDENL